MGRAAPVEQHLHSLPLRNILPLAPPAPPPTTTTTHGPLPSLPHLPSLQDEGRLHLEAAAWLPAAEAAAAGALLLAGLRHVWPMARQYRARRARAGLVLAVCLGTGASLLRALLCSFTPYCLT